MSGNQYKPDPRQTLFLANYLDPKSPTFSNAFQSALKAGYEEEYAKAILSKELDWLAEYVNDDYLVQKAQSNLKEFLENSKDERIKADMTKFTLERLNKKKYAVRSELTGPEGKEIQPVLVKFINGEDDRNTPRV